MSRPVSEPWARALRALGSDRKSGAAEIAERASKWLARAVAAGTREDVLADVASELLLAQSAMAPLYRLANTACLEAAKRRRGVTSILELGARRRVSLGPLLARATTPPRRRAILMTYSWSSTVHGAIVGSRKRIARVVCSEARPGLEGLRLSRSLARRQVPVSLYTDAALMDLPESVDLVVVGADAFVPGGVVNKIGTSALARLARTAGRPFFVLAETSKVLPRALARFYRLPAGPGREIASRAPGLRVENPYFDYTPYRFVTGVLTERGQASIGQLNREMNSLRVSEALLEALGQRDDGVSRSQAGAGAYPFPGFVLR